MTAFDHALKIILKHEGGYVNHPRDPGGETNLGVTKRVWQTWVGRTNVDMRTLTPAKVAPLYKAQYWDKVRGDDFPPALSLVLFDFGVNAGVSRAAKMLQRIVGAVADGQIGRGTRQAVQLYVTAHGLAKLVEAYSEARRDYYRALSTFDTFGRGWLRRVNETHAEAMKLL
jgi:lysozyme family protein